MALFFLTTTVGNLLNGVLYTAVDGVLSNLQVIWLFTGLMVAASCLFALVAARYRPAVPEPDPDDVAGAVAKAGDGAAGPRPADLELANGGAKAGIVASWQ